MINTSENFFRNRTSIYPRKPLEQSLPAKECLAVTKRSIKTPILPSLTVY